MERRATCARWAMVCLIILAGTSRSQDYADFSELDLEALLNQNIVTAAKHSQKLSDAPVAATVITAEEIAASGARSLPEVLRTVPGLDVMQGSSSSFDVSARGLNKLGSNAMLVLVDGRSVYVDFYGMTMWEQLNVSLEDIKVIEVIKGPGSAMHGANAFAGVINIITFSATEKPGTTARVMASDLGESYGSLRYADHQEDLSWKLTTAWDRSADWEHGVDQAENVRFDGQVRFDLRPDSWISAGGGHAKGRSKVLVLEAPILIDGHNGYLRADYVRGDLVARWYANLFSMWLDPIGVDLVMDRARLESTLHDLEFQYALRPGRDHYLIWGGSYRYKQTRFSESAQKVKDDIYAGFVLEEWSPRHDLRISAGLRFEHYSLVGGHLSPRGGLVYKPAPRHNLRLSYSKAYRDPTYIETYWQTEIDLLPGLPQILRGDVDNQSEEIEAVELGYQGLVTDNLLLAAAVFQNNLDKLITMLPVATFPSPPAPAPGIPSEMAFLNKRSWQSRGVEASFRADPFSWLRLAGQYTHIRLEDTETGEKVLRTPAHAASLMARLRTPAGQHVQLTGRYRSRTIWERSGVVPFGGELSEERLALDAAWQAQTEGGSCRVTVAVENLFDRRFRDHPLAIEHRRRLLTSVTVNF